MKRRTKHTEVRQLHISLVVTENTVRLIFGPGDLFDRKLSPAQTSKNGSHPGKLVRLKPTQSGQPVLRL